MFKIVVCSLLIGTGINIALSSMPEWGDPQAISAESKVKCYKKLVQYIPGFVKEYQAAMSSSGQGELSKYTAKFEEINQELNNLSTFSPSELNESLMEDLKKAIKVAGTLMDYDKERTQQMTTLLMYMLTSKPKAQSPATSPAASRKAPTPIREVRKKRSFCWCGCCCGYDPMDAPLLQSIE